MKAVVIPPGEWREIEYKFLFRETNYPIIVGVDTTIDENGHFKVEQFKGAAIAVEYLAASLKIKAFKESFNEYLVKELSKEFKK